MSRCVSEVERGLDVADVSQHLRIDVLAMRFFGVYVLMSLAMRFFWVYVLMSLCMLFLYGAGMERNFRRADSRFSPGAA